MPCRLTLGMIPRQAWQAKKIRKRKSFRIAAVISGEQLAGRQALTPGLSLLSDR